MTPGALLDQLVGGQVLLHKITLVEGWSVTQTLAALRGLPAVKQTLPRFGAPSGSPSLAEELALQLSLPWPSAEGAFLPETYFFPRGTTDRELLLQAHGALVQRLEKAWTGRAPGLPLKPLPPVNSGLHRGTGDGSRQRAPSYCWGVCAPA